MLMHILPADSRSCWCLRSGHDRIKAPIKAATRSTALGLVRGSQGCEGAGANVPGSEITFRGS